MQGADGIGVDGCAVDAVLIWRALSEGEGMERAREQKRQRSDQFKVVRTSYIIHNSKARREGPKGAPASR